MRCQGYRARVLACGPQLRELDGAAITPAERSAAEAPAAGAEPVALPAARPAPVAWPFGAALGVARQPAGPAQRAELRALLVIGAPLALHARAAAMRCACAVTPEVRHVAARQAELAGCLRMDGQRIDGQAQCARCRTSFEQSSICQSSPHHAGSWPWGLPEFQPACGRMRHKHIACLSVQLNLFAGAQEASRQLLAAAARARPTSPRRPRTGTHTLWHCSAADAPSRYQ